MANDEPALRIPAIIRHVIWQSEDGDYGIMAADLNFNSPHYVSQSCPKTWINNGNLIIKSGGLNALGSIIDKPLVFVGKIVISEKYGEQMQSDYCFSDPPTTKEGMLGYLTSLPHIGPAIASRIVQKFSLEEIEDIFHRNLDKLVSMRVGLSPERVKRAKDRWDKDNACRKVYMWTAQNGIGSSIAEKIVKEWGEGAINLLEKDPYLLTKFHGVGFTTADNIAFRILKDVPVDRRTKSCINFSIAELMQEHGHLGVPWNDLRPKVLALLLERDPSKFDQYCKSIDEQVVGQKSAFAVVKNQEGTLLVYHWETWEQEQYISESLTQLGRLKTTFECTDEDINDAEAELRAFYDKPGLILDSLQREAIRSAFEHTTTVLTGGGGVGKSTICRCIAFVARKKRKSIRMMAPTGKAAKVLTLKTSVNASTIHRSLGLVPGECLGTQPISEDIILIDETSMCGIDTMYAIMNAIQQGNPKAHLVLVGDPKQLPSISPGSFLFDIIASGGANVIKLNQIYRQDEHSYITVVANSIADGKLTKIPADANDIKWKEIDNNTNVPMIVAEVVKKHLEAGFDPQEIQVLSPMYKYDCGVDAINNAIQQTVAEYRKHTNCLAHKFHKFYVGDKVIQLENDYEKDVFNGDVGIVEAIGKRNFRQPVKRRVGKINLDDGLNSKDEPQESFVKVSFENREPIYYTGSEIESIRPAWCITVHKFQGSQCKRIIFVLANEHSRMANRELVYTAITRGEKMVFLLGSTRTFEFAPTKSIIHRRYTSLADLIRQNMTGEKLLEVMTVHQDGIADDATDELVYGMEDLPF